MSRYTGWRRLSGDGAARPDLLDLGKKLLGQLDARRQASGLKTLSIQRQLPDGSIVRARFDGDIPAIDVMAARPAGQRRREEPFTPEGIVVTARNTALPTGIDAEHPQQILQFVEDEWTTYFYDASSDTFTAFSGNKGTYVRRFRDGIDNAGNLDWIGAKPEGGTDADRVRLNYYGPMRRYWYDGWRKPDAQYGRWVFLNGQVLLDIEAVNTARAAASLPTFDETLVLGAAYRDGWLYVMQARINAFGTEASAIPGRAGFPDGSAGWISPPYPDGDSDLRLVRYRVGAKALEPPRAPAYSVRPESAETLWTRTARGQVNPWVFSPDVTAAETFAMPDEVRIMYWTADPSSASGDETTEQLLPSESSEHISLALTHAEDAVVVDAAVDVLSMTLTTTVPLDGGEAGLYSEESAAIAADYTPDGDRVELIYTARLYRAPSASPRGHILEFDTVRIGAGPEVTLLDRLDTIDGTYSQFHTLALVDLRFGCLALDGTEALDTVSGDGEYAVAETRLYESGVLAATLASSAAPAADYAANQAAWWRQVALQALAIPSGGDGARAVSPLFLLFGVALWSRYLYFGGAFSSDSLSTHIALRAGGQFPVAVPPQDRAGQMREQYGTNNYFPYTVSMAGTETPLSMAPADARGYRTPASLAVDADRVLLSLNRCVVLSNALMPEPTLWGARAVQRAQFSVPATDPAVFFSSHYATDASLPTLTGIDDDGARFAPIWQFGAYPQL